MFLEVRGVSKVFGGLWAVKDYNLTLPAGRIYGLIGPNGAGKTTIFNLVSGLLPVTEGKILFKGRDITNLRPDQRAALGVTRNFQSLRLFKSLSVVQNLKIARHMHLKYGLLGAVLNLPRFMREERKLGGFGDEILTLFGLNELKEKIAGSLPYVSSGSSTS